uniref:Phosphate ABC transporter, permease protein PstC n=1 Tax=Paulinella chromatophora TaxID=39717 RepID=B1X3U3_PAUCH|nr:Phosphate ABC transporter, permease protein PstC [Paulinella chromatophora]ACB42612.1 Phosphate ABC transporter, permease protein PstC [Paulinella chromatophora]
MLTRRQLIILKRHKPIMQKKRKLINRLLEFIFKQILLMLSSVIGMIILGFLLTIISGAAAAIKCYGLDFILSPNWNPANNQYGVLTAIYGTIVTSVVSLSISTPLGIGTAIFLAEDIVSHRIREVLTLLVELLAAIPSIVLGLWGILVMKPALMPFLHFLHERFGHMRIFNTSPIGPGIAFAIMLLAVMTLPIITTITKGALESVPLDLTQAAYGLGASRWQVISSISLPVAAPEIINGIMLAIGRAMGETMAVTMIIGNTNQFNWSILGPGNTIASMLSNQFGEADDMQMSALMYASLVLIVLNIIVIIFVQSTFAFLTRTRRSTKTL